MTAREQLQELGEAREDLKEDLETTSLAIQDAAYAAKAEGISMTEIAQTLGISRQGLYYLLEEKT